MSIQNINSAPKYISDFIHNNLETLNNIYQDGIQKFKDGVLGFQCSEKENIIA